MGLDRSQLRRLSKDFLVVAIGGGGRNRIRIHPKIDSAPNPKLDPGTRFGFVLGDQVRNHDLILLNEFGIVLWVGPDLNPFSNLISSSHKLSYLLHDIPTPIFVIEHHETTIF